MIQKTISLVLTIGAYKPFVAVTADELVFGYDDTLVALAHRFYPRNKRPASKMGLLITVIIIFYLFLNMIKICFVITEKRYVKRNTHNVHGALKHVRVRSAEPPERPGPPALLEEEPLQQHPRQRGLLLPAAWRHRQRPSVRVRQRPVPHPAIEVPRPHR